MQVISHQNRTFIQEKLVPPTYKSASAVQIYESRNGMNVVAVQINGVHQRHPLGFVVYTVTLIHTPLPLFRRTQREREKAPLLSLLELITLCRTLRCWGQRTLHRSMMSQCFVSCIVQRQLGSRACRVHHWYELSKLSSRILCFDGARAVFAYGFLRFSQHCLQILALSFNSQLQMFLNLKYFSHTYIRPFTHWLNKILHLMFKFVFWVNCWNIHEL